MDVITTAHVMAVLVPIWNTRRETARRGRQPIGAAMKRSVAHRYRQDNSAGEAVAEALPRDGLSAKARLARTPPSICTETDQGIT